MFRLRQGRLCLALLLHWPALYCVTPARAQSEAGPHVIVLATDYLSLDELHSQVGGGVGTTLMSTGVQSGPDPLLRVYAELGAGDSISVGDVSQGRLRDALRQFGKRCAVVGDADGDDTGPYDPTSALLPNPDDLRIGAASGEVDDPLAPGGRRIEASRMAAVVQDLVNTDDIVVVYDGDLCRAEREYRLHLLTDRAYAIHRAAAIRRLADLSNRLQTLSAARRNRTDAYLLSSSPKPLASGMWDRMPIIAGLHLSNRFALPTDRTFVSDTTRTPGIVAARDVAPTILRDLGVATPIQMTGSRLRMVAVPFRVSPVDRDDGLTALNMDAQLPFFWALGLGGAGFVFYAVYLLGTGVKGKTGFVRYGLRALSAWPLALLLAPLCHTTSLPSYLSTIIALCFAIALIPSPDLIAVLTAIVVACSARPGGLVAQSLLSDYWLSGIRFYGIGNEYMGVLIAGCLLCITTLAPKQQDDSAHLLGRRRRKVTACAFAAGVIVLSCPALGAKAGGAITSVATFVFAWRLLKGKRIGPSTVLVGVGGGLAVVAAWALVDKVMPLAGPTHIDTAFAALGQGRFGYILGVAARKTGMAAHILLHPGTLLGLLGFAILGGIAVFALRARVSRYLESDTARRIVLGAGWRGALVALLVNDSGAVAAILMMTTLILPCLHDMMGQQAASAIGPSVTREAAKADS